jgi:hypothetical protein
MQQTNGQQKREKNGLTEGKEILPKSRRGSGFSTQIQIFWVFGVLVVVASIPHRMQTHPNCIY